MAGIGFELKKLFVGRGAIRKIRAYAYVSVISSGTMFLSLFMLFGIQGIAALFGVQEEARSTLLVLIVYAMLCSMLLASAFQTFLSRYVADALYSDHPEYVLPSLFGASLFLMVPGGILYALLLAFAPIIPLIHRVVSFLLFLELIPTWLMMSYITAAKDYRRVLLSFGGGVGVSLSLGYLLALLGVQVTTALLFALVVGYGVMLCSFTGVLLKYFPMGSGNCFRFLGAFDKTGDLILTGFLGMTGACIHIVIMWFGPLGTCIAGPFRQAGNYDMAAFYAFLITLPSNISFIISIEVNFHIKYRLYFNAITEGGTLAEINRYRQSMLSVLNKELVKLTQIQTYCMILYIVLMRYILMSLGFAEDMVTMFQVISIGYSAYAIGNSLMLLQLYFNDRRGALFTTGTFFTVTTLGTILTCFGAPLYYGLGLAMGGLAMYLVSFPRLYRYTRDINYHVFCEQPVLASDQPGFWTVLAADIENGTFFKRLLKGR